MARRTEAAFWSYLRGLMSPYWAVQRHEDQFTVGIPDISYSMLGVNGWIELKSIAIANADSVIKIPHFTTSQYQWLKRHGKRGGNCYIFIEVNRKLNPEKDYLLIPHDQMDVIGEFNLKQLIDVSKYHSHNRIDITRLIKALL